MSQDIENIKKQIAQLEGRMPEPSERSTLAKLEEEVETLRARNENQTHRIAYLVEKLTEARVTLKTQAEELQELKEAHYSTSVPQSEAPTPAKPVLFTTEDVADILHLSVPIIGAYIKDKRIKAVKVGRKWLVTPEAVHAFLDASENNQ